MFTDDTNITLAAKTLTELKQSLIPELSKLSCWLRANKLSLNVAQTEMIIGSRQRLSVQNEDVEIRIDDQIIKKFEHTKSLGVTIDAQLIWCKLVEEKLSLKKSSAIGALKRVRPFILKETAIQIYNALIVPYLDYCSPVWDCLSGYLSDKLHKIQNRAARVITKLPFDTNSNHLLTTLNWERLSIRRKKLKALMMYKTMNGHATDYLQRLFTQYYSNCNLRN